MTSKEVAALYLRSGHVPPASIAAPSAEHIRNTRRKLCHGIEFRSTLEADAYQILLWWRRAGLIRDLFLQPRFVLQEKFKRDGKTIRAMTYKADFEFICEEHSKWKQGDRVVIEAKGFRTQPYLMRRKLFLARYPNIVFVEWDRSAVRELC